MGLIQLLNEVMYITYSAQQGSKTCSFFNSSSINKTQKSYLVDQWFQIPTNRIIFAIFIPIRKASLFQQNNFRMYLVTVFTGVN